MNPSTVEDVINRIETRFPRAAAQFSTILEEDLESWIAELADVFPFWFLTIYPGANILSHFPYQSFTSTTLPTFIQGTWVDAGWFMAVPGQAVYDIWAPLEDGQAHEADWWVPAKVNMLDYIYEFTNQGSFTNSLPVPEHEDVLNFISYRTHGRPTQAIWRSIEDRSQIILSPVPDKYYLYATQFSIKNPANYLDPASGRTRNRFLTNAPEAVLAKGLLEAARFFDEKTMADQLEKLLYGVNFVEGNANSGAVGGILGRYKRNTILRNRRAREQLQAFRSLTMATGSALGMSLSRYRFGGNRYHGSGRWYT